MQPDLTDFNLYLVFGMLTYKFYFIHKFVDKGEEFVLFL